MPASSIPLDMGLQPYRYQLGPYFLLGSIGQPTKMGHGCMGSTETNMGFGGLILKMKAEG